MKNHKGSLTFPEYVDIPINKEVDLGATLGPYSINPLSSNLKLITSALNTVPKKNLEDRRVILDLSFPHGKSVNNGIQKSGYLGTEYTLSYPTIDDFIDIIINKGEGCLMYKKDLRRAYRQIPVDPGDINIYVRLLMLEGQLFY